jgi:hypothetical protein
MLRIIVDNEEEKKQLLEALEFIYDVMGDHTPGYELYSLLVNLHKNPDQIKVGPPPLDFVSGLAVAQSVFEKYKVDQRKWWSRLDGTPMLNDLSVRMTQAFLGAVDQKHKEDQEWYPAVIDQPSVTAKKPARYWWQFFSRN